jgi:lysozyme
VNREKLAAQLSIDEGRRKKLYKDTVGKNTGGVGHNFDDKGLSDAVIDLMLQEDIQDAINDLDKRLPWWKRMSEARQGVICNMCFNLGIDRLLGFKNTLADMEAGRYDHAADGMLASLWAKQVGPRAQRLADIMRKGTD